MYIHHSSKFHTSFIILLASKRLDYNHKYFTDDITNNCKYITDDITNNCKYITDDITNNCKYNYYR